MFSLRTVSQTMKQSICIALLYLTINQALAQSADECGEINFEKFHNTQSVTEIDEFPWIARVAFNSTNYKRALFVTRYRCLASLISERYLITTARCASDTPFDTAYAVLFGDWNTENDVHEVDCDEISGKCCGTNLIEIEEIILHPSYSAVKRTHDIALLRLSEVVNFSEFVRPICLPGAEVANKEFGAEELKLTGWLDRVKGQKRKMSVFMYNPNDCQRKILALATYALSANVYMCGIADDVGVSFMPGAALMDITKAGNSQHKHAYLVGLLAYTTMSCTSRAQDVFIRIDPYLNWIKENIY